MTRRIRVFAGAAVLLSVSGATAACSSPETVSCASWVDFETPADAVESADGVAVGTVVGRGEDVVLMGGDAHTWTVEVTTWVAGHGESPITVATMPDHCIADPPYPDGDPLEPFLDGTSVMLFLNDTANDGGDNDVWATLTPYQGVVPAPSDGEVPAAW